MFRSILNFNDSLNYGYARQPYEHDEELYIKDPEPKNPQPKPQPRQPWEPAPEQDWPTMPDGKSGKGGSPMDGPFFDQGLNGDDGDNTLWLGSSVANKPYLNGTVYGWAGNDNIQGNIGKNGDYLSGGSGNDTIRAMGHDDSLFGGDDDDFLYADGSTKMYGGNGSDYIYGGNSNDLLDGGYGRDWLKGGGGADTFRFTQVDRAWWSDDGIEDFSRAEGDKIHLLNLYDGSQSVKVNGFHDLNIVDYGNHWKVFIEDDIKFGVLKGDYGQLQASDFIFDSV